MWGHLAKNTLPPPLAGEGNQGPSIPRDKAWTANQVCLTESPQALLSSALRELGKSIHAVAPLLVQLALQEVETPEIHILDNTMGSRSHSPNLPPTGRAGDTLLPGGSPRSDLGVVPLMYTEPKRTTCPPCSPQAPPLSGVTRKLEFHLSSLFGAFPHCQTPILRSRDSQEGPIWRRA